MLPQYRVQSIHGVPLPARFRLDMLKHMPEILLTQAMLPIYSAINLWTWCVIEVMLSGGRSNALCDTLTS
jgi:hypothetical protein